jgi:hypothetical protein
MRVQRITVMHESMESLTFTHVEVECNLLQQMRLFFYRKQMGWGCSSSVSRLVPIWGGGIKKTRQASPLELFARTKGFGDVAASPAL